MHCLHHFSRAQVQWCKCAIFFRDIPLNWLIIRPFSSSTLYSLVSCGHNDMIHSHEHKRTIHRNGNWFRCCYMLAAIFGEEILHTSCFVRIEIRPSHKHSTCQNRPRHSRSTCTSPSRKPSVHRTYVLVFRFVFCRQLLCYLVLTRILLVDSSYETTKELRLWLAITYKEASQRHATAKFSRVEPGEAFRCPQPPEPSSGFLGLLRIVGGVAGNDASICN